MLNRTLFKSMSLGGGAVGSALIGATGTYFSLPFLQQTLNSGSYSNGQTEIDRLENLLKENDSIIRDKEKEVGELTARIKQKESEILEKVNLNDQNEEQLTRHKQTTYNLSDRLNIQLTNIKKADSDIEESQRLSEEQAKSIEDQSEKIKDLGKQITDHAKEAKTESDKQEGEIKTNRAAINQKNEEIAEQTKANRLQRDSLENDRKELAKLKEDLQAKTTQLRSALEEKQRMEKALEQEKENLAKATEESNRLKSDLQNKNNSYAQAERTNKQQKQQISQDKAIIERLEGEEAEHKSSIETKTTITSILQDSNNAKADKIKEYGETISGLELQINKKVIEISEIQKKLPQTNKNLEDEKEKIKRRIDWMNVDFHHIAEDPSKSFNFHSIEKNKVTLSSKTTGSSTFTIGESSDTKTITVQVNDFKEKSKINDLLRKYWETGFVEKREEVGDAYEKWIQNPTFTLKTYKLCDNPQGTDNQNFSACDVQEDNINIEQYFQENWRKYATQALFSLEPFVSTGKIKKVSNNNFELTSTDYKDTTGGGFIRVNGDGKKTVIWQNAFPDKDNFIKYWTLKTKELINKGRMDFSDVISPIIVKDNYQ